MPTVDNATAEIERVTRSARDGIGAALVVEGGRAEGKTTALQRIEDEHAGLVTVLRAAGSPDEQAQPYALLEQLCGRWRAELPVESGRGGVEQASRWLVETVAGFPALILVDDVHWVDSCSARVLAYVARRVRGRALGIVLTTAAGKPIHSELARLPSRQLPGVDEATAHALAGDAPEHVRAHLVRLCEGNPLVLREFRELVLREQLHGRVPLPRRVVLGHRSLRRFSAPWSGLAGPARRWLLVLALGNCSLQDRIRAARSLGLDLDDLAPAEQDDVVRVRDTWVVWQSSLLRDAVIQAATLGERTRVAGALAAAIDPGECPAEHARLLAESMTQPDPAASALAEATVPMARTGMLLDAYDLAMRATELTTDPAERERYRIIAAELAWLAGYSDHALDLLGNPAAVDRSADALTSALIMQAVIHGFKESWSAGWQLLPIDGRHEPGSPGHAIRLLVTALTAGWESASRESLQRTVTRLRNLDDPGFEPVPGAVHTLERVVAGHSDTTAADRRALLALAWWARPSDALHPKAWPPRLLPVFLGEEDAYAQHFSGLLRTEHVQAARSTRALLLLKLATVQTALGQWDRAARNAGNGARLAEELGHHALHSELLLTLAWVEAERGREHACVPHLDAVDRHEGVRQGQLWAQQWIRSIAARTNGRPSEAFERIHPLHQGPAVTPHHLILRRLSTVDAVEAAVQADRHTAATELVTEFADWVEAGAAAWAWADLALCRALLDDDAGTETWHVLAIERSVASGRLLSTARAELHFGCWLRRRRRDREARAHLRIAEERFERLGALASRERAHAERRATGETQRERPRSPEELTPQELHIAKLAADGLTNRQIAHALSLSPRTVGYHLYKVFPKLDITSRSQLATVLNDSP